MTPAWVRDPRIIALAFAVLTMLLTAGARLSTGLWFFLLVFVFLGGWKATELFQSGTARYR